MHLRAVAVNSPPGPARLVMAEGTPASMRHWNRSVSLVPSELADYLQQEIKRRWPEDPCPFHIEVLGEATSSRFEVRVWNRTGLEITREASPEDFLGWHAKSPTIAAVLTAVESAVAEAQTARKGRVADEVQ